MHPDLERERFLAHIETLREQLDLHESSPKEDRRRLAEMRARVEKVEAQNAVLSARLAGSEASVETLAARQSAIVERLAGAASPVPGDIKGCRRPQSGIGSLSFAQIVEMHRRQIDRAAIAAAAGVNPTTISRWRIANDYVMMYAPRVQGNTAGSEPAEGQ